MEGKRIKKVLYALLCLTMLFTISGCSNSSEEKNNSTSSKKLKAEISNSGWYYENDGVNKYAHYGIELSNPNENYQLNNIEYKVTLLDKDGGVIDTSTRNLSVPIFPKEKYATGEFMDVAEKPAKVEFEVIDPGDDGFEKPDNIYKQENFVLTKQKKLGEEGNLKVTGFVQNNTESKTSIVVAALFYKDNKLVDVCNELIEKVDSKGNVSFSIDCYSVSTKFDKYEVKAHKIDW